MKRNDCDTVLDYQNGYAIGLYWNSILGRWIYIAFHGDTKIGSGDTKNETLEICYRHRDKPNLTKLRTRFW